MNVIGKPNIELRILLDLTESEAGALADLGSYGFKPFLETFKEKLGSSYIEKHEEGLKPLLETSYAKIQPWLDKVERVRNNFQGVIYGI